MSGTSLINERYEIQRRVGRGGMADVFLARDQLLDRQVAVKMLFPEFAVDPNFVERFRREAQAAANLSHPNIVNVYDWGRHEGTYFITMEYVEGRTLAEILKTNRLLTPKQAAEIASEVAAALGFAHDANLAHRDIKPANILIGTNGQVKVADFGIARAMNSAAEAKLTQAGSVMGTASYFSPEQAQGAQPEPRSDLYSLGIVMYEMVAGKPPFSGDNPLAIAYKQVHDKPTPLNQLVDDVPRPFEAIVAKLLAKDPKLRYPSAHALRDDLKRFRNGEQVQALVAAAARPGACDPESAPTAATTTVSTYPDVVDPTPAEAPLVPGAPTTVLPPQATADVSQYPPGASPEARYYQDGNSRTGWYALMAFVALIALVAGSVLLYQRLTTPADEKTVQVTLDDYTGKPLDEVTAALKALNIEVTAIPEENSTVPPGTVHRTIPPPNTLIADGTVIQLFHNPVKNLVKVPLVTGLDNVQAKALLAAAGFQVESVGEQNTIGKGLVIRTEPEGGARVSQLDPIRMVVSEGPDTKPIPSVVGFTLEQARDALTSDELRFVVTVTESVDDIVPKGSVITSDPPPNTYHPRGGEVKLVVSTGPGNVVVPPLKGIEEGKARNLVDNKGLQSAVVQVDVPAGDPQDGKVIEQSLAAGVSVPKGSTITLSVGRAVAPVSTTTTSTTTTTTTTTTTLPPAPVPTSPPDSTPGSSTPTVPQPTAPPVSQPTVPPTPTSPPTSNP